MLQPESSGQSPDILLSQWRNGLRIQHIAHSQSAVRFARLGRSLGVALVVSTTIVGSSIFATIESTPSIGWKIAAGMLSTLAAVLAALQTFLGYSERAELHRILAQKYGDLRRDVEQLLALGALDSEDVGIKLTAIRKNWGELEGQSPTVPQDIVDRAVRNVGQPRK